MTAGRWDLLRTLGAFADSPADARAASRILRLPEPDGAAHTEAFVLNCPPYASVYLGPDGVLGGEGTDRAAGFWRALGISPPAEPDHLSALLSLYASLGEAVGGPSGAGTAAALARAQAALFWEHLWPWLPSYLDAAADLASPSVTAWAELTRSAVSAEFDVQPAAAQLPLALRAAPPITEPGSGLTDLLSMLLTPVRSGIILTRRRLADGASQAGVGHRVGERRFALRAMLEQDPGATLDWLGREAARWARRHENRSAADAASNWWAARAAQTARALRDLAATARTARKPAEGTAA